MDDYTLPALETTIDDARKEIGATRVTLTAGERAEVLRDLAETLRLPKGTEVSLETVAARAQELLTAGFAADISADKARVERRVSEEQVRLGLTAFYGAHRLSEVPEDQRVAALPLLVERITHPEGTPTRSWNPLARMVYGRAASKDRAGDANGALRWSRLGHMVSLGNRTGVSTEGAISHARGLIANEMYDSAEEYLVAILNRIGHNGADEQRAALHETLGSLQARRYAWLTAEDSLYHAVRLEATPAREGKLLYVLSALARQAHIAKSRVLDEVLGVHLAHVIPGERLINEGEHLDAVLAAHAGAVTAQDAKKIVQAYEGGLRHSLYHARDILASEDMEKILARVEQFDVERVEAREGVKRMAKELDRHDTSALARYVLNKKRAFAFDRLKYEASPLAATRTQALTSVTSLVREADMLYGGLAEGRARAAVAMKYFGSEAVRQLEELTYQVNEKIKAGGRHFTT